jgi:hypothetical protein
LHLNIIFEICNQCHWLADLWGNAVEVSLKTGRLCSQIKFNFFCSKK